MNILFDESKIFCEKFRCYIYDKITDDTIILPESVLTELSNKSLDLPYHFRLSSDDGINRYCSVHSFTAPNNTVLISHNLMNTLFSTQGDILEITYVNIPKCTNVVFKNIGEYDICKLYNPVCVLERFLRNKSILQINDIINIPIKELERTYQLQITNLSPDNVVSIKDTNINLKFEEQKN